MPVLPTRHDSAALFADPQPDRYCYIFDAIAAIVSFAAPETGAAIGALAPLSGAAGEGIFGSAGPIFGAGAGTAAAGTGLAEGATTLPELLVTAPGAAGTAGAEGAALGSAGLGAALGGAADVAAPAASALDMALGAVPGGAPTPSGIAGATGNLGPTGTPGATSPGASNITAPTAASPASPTAAGPLSPTATGAGLGGDAAQTVASDVAAASGNAPSDAFGQSILKSAGIDPNTVAAGKAAASNSGGFFDSAIGDLTGGALNSRDLGLAASLGGLGATLLRSGQQLPGQPQTNQLAGTLQEQGNQLTSQGQTLMSYLQSGNLPPGIQQGINQAKTAAVAKIKSDYARRSESGSSAEQQDLQAASDRATAAGADIATQLLNSGANIVTSGINADSIASQIYNQITQQAIQEDQQLGQAISTFASSLVGTPQITIKTGA